MCVHYPFAFPFSALFPLLCLLLSFASHVTAAVARISNVIVSPRAGPYCCCLLALHSDLEPFLGPRERAAWPSEDRARSQLKLTDEARMPPPYRLGEEAKKKRQGKGEKEVRSL
jgi:hypothetical protein